MRQPQPRRRTNITVGAVISGVLLYGAGAGADAPRSAAAASRPAAALPSFQPGLWQYRRTLFNQGGDKPQVTEVTKCTDPTSDIRQKMASLRGKSCQFSPPRYVQDRYVSNWLCQTPNGPARFHDVLMVTGATSYVDVSEAQLAQRVTRSRLEAHRLGDCPAHAAIPRNPGLKPLPGSKPSGDARAGSNP